LPTVTHLDLYYTSATTNLAYAGAVTVNQGTFSAVIPADCVFTLTGFTGVNVTITNPVNGAQFNAPATIPIAATAATTTGSIALVGFYNGAALLGDDTVAPYGFTWGNVPMGDYSLTALAGDTLGDVGTSAVVNVTVVGALAQITVSPTNATLPPGATQQYIATGADLMGHTLNPPPAFLWSVTGGGTIAGNGLFTAGSLSGGPFNVTAGSGGLFGTGTVTVTATTGGTTNGGSIGNTINGTSTDNLWDNGAWINASRFRATNNLGVTTIFAKVVAVPGKYKCAIYTDNSGLPNRLLLASGEVSNPASGWQSFPLAASVTLTNGSYYWLAVWSDNANAQVYYSGNNGTLRWGQYNYGSWPDPISTSGGSSFNYCIYATGPAAATLTSISVTPASPSIIVGGTQQFTATGTYSDGSTQNITSQAAWASSNAVVATIITSGLATGASVGTATISAKLGAVTGTTTVFVQPPVLVSIAVTPTASSIVIGGTQQFKAVGTYSDGSIQNVSSQVTWISTNAVVAAVSSNGLATAASAGSTTISATLAGVTGSALLTVQAPPSLTLITVTPANPSILIGTAQQFIAIGSYSDGSTQNVSSQATWISSNLVVAAINSNGVATAASGGATTISATLAGVTGSALLTVQAPPSLTLITVTPATANLVVGGTQQFVATGTYSDSSTQNVSSQATWVSSNAVVAAISSNGVATAASGGATTISATLAGVTGSALLTVQAPPSLTQIAVTPANPIILIGAAQQFIASGNYSDGSTQNVSSQVTWISSQPAVASLNASGLASGISAGTANMTATLAGITGTTVLTVQALPLTINTVSLPGGTVNAAYSATLSASGGTTPYQWSLSSGSFPAGLTLNSNSGSISGIPTVAGTFSISVQASDAGNPVQVATKLLSIVIASASSTVSIWPSNTVPGVVDSGPDSSVELGV
ncbi:MAG: Ig-like domain-containing protein, partial [Verrucomicrobiia bacterium]